MSVRQIGQQFGYAPTGRAAMLADLDRVRDAVLAGECDVLALGWTTRTVDNGNRYHCAIAWLDESSHGALIAAGLGSRIIRDALTSTEHTCGEGES